MTHSTPPSLQISQIMDRFNFKRVHQTMVALNWTWASARCPNTDRSTVPSIEQIKSAAYELLHCAATGYEGCSDQKSGFSVSTGGFTARVVVFSEAPPRLQLSFYVEEADYCPYLD
jgi:hypothetical protein